MMLLPLVLPVKSIHKNVQESLLDSSYISSPPVIPATIYFFFFFSSTARFGKSFIIALCHYYQRNKILLLLALLNIESGNHRALVGTCCVQTSKLWYRRTWCIQGDVSTCNNVKGRSIDLSYRRSSVSLSLPLLLSLSLSHMICPTRHLKTFSTALSFFLSHQPFKMRNRVNQLEAII